MRDKTVRLSGIRKGQSCVIESFTDEKMKLKLLEMGCLPGEIIRVDRLAPFGDPMAITVSESTLSIRLDEADTIMVQPMS
jgi:ferrous iron transport protein A